jgi:hypothetical protein
MKQWNLWMKALKAAYTSLGQVLNQWLGRWTDTPSQIWYNFYDPSKVRQTPHVLQFCKWLAIPMICWTYGDNNHPTSCCCNSSSLSNPVHFTF